MATATMTREAFRDLLAQLPDDPGALHAAITAHAHRQEVR